MRYVNLSTVLVFRLVAAKVHSRFPNYQALVKAKILLPHEAARLQAVDARTPHETTYIPILWVGCPDFYESCTVRSAAILSCIWVPEYLIPQRPKTVRLLPDGCQIFGLNVMEAENSRSSNGLNMGTYDLGVIF